MEKITLNLITKLSEGEIKDGVYLLNNNIVVSKNNIIYNTTSSLDNSKFIKSSELNEKLKSRDWNITERKYINKTQLYVRYGNGEQPIDVLNSTELDLIGNSVVDSSIISDRLKESFRNDESIKEILNKMIKNEIYLYKSEINVVDFLSESITITLLDNGSGIYTDTLNLNELSIISVLSEEISAKLDLSIQYSVKGKIYNYLTSFEILKIEDKIVKFSNIIESVASKVNIEFLNGILRTIPISDDVTEIIINNCSVTYGNLNL